MATEARRRVPQIDDDVYVTRPMLGRARESIDDVASMRIPDGLGDARMARTAQAQAEATLAVAEELRMLRECLGEWLPTAGRL